MAKLTLESNNKFAKALQITSEVDTLLIALEIASSEMESADVSRAIGGLRRISSEIYEVLNSMKDVEVRHA
jgi:hypothetical protein